MNEILTGAYTVDNFLKALEDAGVSEAEKNAVWDAIDLVWMLQGYGGCQGHEKLDYARVTPQYEFLSSALENGVHLKVGDRMNTIQYPPVGLPPHHIKFELWPTDWLVTVLPDGDDDLIIFVYEIV